MQIVIVVINQLEWKHYSTACSAVTNAMV
jgi:hypothetical protein